MGAPWPRTRRWERPGGVCRAGPAGRASPRRAPPLPEGDHPITRARPQGARREGGGGYGRAGDVPAPLARRRESLGRAPSHTPGKRRPCRGSFGDGARVPCAGARERVGPRGARGFPRRCGVPLKASAPGAFGAWGPWPLLRRGTGGDRGWRCTGPRGPQGRRTRARRSREHVAQGGGGQGQGAGGGIHPDFRKGAAGRLGAQGPAPRHALTRSRRGVLLRSGARLTLRDSGSSPAAPVCRSPR